MSHEGADAAAALKINAAFYDAFARASLAAMDSIWAQQEPVLCTHPGGHTLRGRVAVMASWQNLFHGGSPRIRFSGEGVVLVRGLAFVNCLEHIADKTLAATNILVWEAGGWRFVCHAAGMVSGPTTRKGTDTEIRH